MKSIAGQKIGVLDSGVGGLTVVKALQELLPAEGIVYYGDSANVPYGNKEQAELLRLMNNILDFMESQEVKCIAVGCNTLSTLYDFYAPSRKTKIFSIVEAGVRKVLADNINKVGVVASEFTIKTGWYARLIHMQNPNVKVWGAGNHDLASLIDTGCFAAVPSNIKENLKVIRTMGSPQHIILACTHYPIVMREWEKAAPDVTFIDPAIEMAAMIKEWLIENNLQQHQKEKEHAVEIYTSGDPEIYGKMCEHIVIQNTDKIVKHILN